MGFLPHTEPELSRRVRWMKIPVPLTKLKDLCVSGSQLKLLRAVLRAWLRNSCRKAGLEGWSCCGTSQGGERCQVRDPGEPVPLSMLRGCCGERLLLGLCFVLGKYLPSASSGTPVVWPKHSSFPKGQLVFFPFYSIWEF